jgi:hypothetical protein
VNPGHTTADTIQYGFKRISLTNLTELDDKPPHLFRRRSKKWVQACLAPQLDACVPEEIAFLYETARGSMVYGMFFQPLASLAAEQCYRVLEAGVRHRCVQLGLIKKKRLKGKALPEASFAEIVAALERAQRIPNGDSDAWKMMVFLRNLYSHPKSQLIQSTDTPVEVVAYTAKLLNRLYR